MTVRHPALLSSTVETPEVRHRRSLPQIMGFEAYQVLAVTIVLMLLTPFWASFVIAFIVACGLQPAIRGIEKKLHLHQGNFAFFAVSFLCAAMVGMVGYTAVRVARLTVEFAEPTSDTAKVKSRPAVSETATPPTPETEPTKPVPSGSSLRSLDQIKMKVKTLASKWAPSYGKDVDAFLNALPKNTVTWLASHAQDFVSSTFEILTQMAFFFVFLFLFLSKGRKLLILLLKKKRETQPRIKLWYDIVETASFTSVVSTATIGFIQATIVTIACHALGFSEWGLIFFGCFILSFFPVLGPATIPFGLALSSFLEGDTARGLWLAGLATFAGTIDNLLRPLFVSAEHDINPLLSFVAMVGAISIFGVAGLLLGPFLVTVSALLLSDKAKEGFRPL